MSNLIITVGRENGSGGRHVGEELAKSLGVKCYDKELLAETARESGFAAKFIEENEERKPQLFWGTGAFYMYEQPISVQLYVEQSKIIKKIAERESCVIVGRCADYVLNDFSDVINVYIHAPLDVRVKRIMERDGIAEDKARSAVSKLDKARSAYYNYFTNKVWGSAKNYHLSLDTGEIGIQGAVEMIKSYIKIRNG